MLIKRIVAYSALAVVSAALVALFVRGVRSTGEAERSVCLSLTPQAMNVEAPAFSLSDLDGTKASLAANKGKVVLLHFWATWCPPCIEELPGLVRLARQMRGNDKFSLMTVSVDDNAAIVKQFLGKHGMSELPVLMDTTRKVPQAYATTKYPESYLIDGGGRVRYRFVNKRNWGSPVAVKCIGNLMRPPKS